MNSREIYQTLREHMLTQNQKAFISQDIRVYAYRGEGGLMCPVGKLIPDEMYDPSLEMRGIDSFPDELLSHILPSDMDDLEGRRFIIRFQGIHDFLDVEDWEHKLDILAFDYDLYNHEEGET